MDLPVLIPPRLASAVDAVVAPVPPLAIGITPVEEIDDTFTKSEPFQATTAVSLTAKVTPVVGPTPRIFTVYVPDVLMTMYAFDCAGAVIVMFADAGEHKRMACLAWLAAPVVVVKVVSAVSVCVPAIAESSSEVMLLFTVSPHVPESSPVTGSANPKSDVYAVVIVYLKLLLLPN